MDSIDDLRSLALKNHQLEQELKNTKNEVASLRMQLLELQKAPETSYHDVDDFYLDDGIDEIMTCADFKEAVDCNAFTDEDGSGYYGTATKRSNVAVDCGKISVRGTDPNFTHVWWYSK